MKGKQHIEAAAVGKRSSGMEKGGGEEIFNHGVSGQGRQGQEWRVTGSTQPLLLPRQSTYSSCCAAAGRPRTAPTAPTAASRWAPRCSQPVGRSSRGATWRTPATASGRALSALPSRKPSPRGTPASGPWPLPVTWGTPSSYPVVPADK